ncbi:MAG: Diadenosine hexaphosphate (Ap6A) hydrolase; Bis(5'-nucleosyl)-tetraphosphatase (Ap4A) (Asymmetrical), partial [uncultured Thermoleophilia bacterium]
CGSTRRAAWSCGACGAAPGWRPSVPPAARRATGRCRRDSSIRARSRSRRRSGRSSRRRACACGRSGRRRSSTSATSTRATGTGSSSSCRSGACGPSAAAWARSRRAWRSRSRRCGGCRSTRPRGFWPTVASRASSPACARSSRAA